MTEELFIHKKDDIIYEITISKNKSGKYYGNWLCTKNNQTGGSSDISSSKDKILISNKLNIDAYHFHNISGTKSSG